MSSKTALIILDGRGMTTNIEKSATAAAHTPFIDWLYKEAPFCQLQASEEAVWLPAWQVGNSEVGHSTLGAWRVNYQNLVRINKAIEDGNFYENQKLIDHIYYAIENEKNIHLLGLVSDGWVHSHEKHLFALIDAIEMQLNKAPNIACKYFIHAITDGRDTDPKSGLWHIQKLVDTLEGTQWDLISIVWRYYAMDRDNRRERVNEAYKLLTHRLGHQFIESEEVSGVPHIDPIKAVQQRYDEWETDEFIKPLNLTTGDYGCIEEWDVVIFFNFRSDRAREITSALTQSDYPEYGMKKIDNLKFLCMTEYDASFKDVEILFPPISLANTLGEILSKNNKTQLRIAETEKYPHVTFFFNNGIEEPYQWEKRILIPSPKVATYDLQPEMSALEITEHCISYVHTDHPDFICLNYANPDMVGHTGDFDAVVKACEVVDSYTEKLCKELLQSDYQIIIIADHGNADYMRNEDGTPNTAHSLALVPCFLLWNTNDILKLRDGSLADIAPTILDLMGITKPEEMTGKSLIL